MPELHSVGNTFCNVVYLREEWQRTLYPVESTRMALCGLRGGVAALRDSALLLSSLPASPWLQMCHLFIKPPQRFPGSCSADAVRAVLGLLPGLLLCSRPSPLPPARAG